MALSPLDVTLLRLSVGICLGDWALLRDLRLAAPAGEPNRAWREAVLQAHLFAGFPRLVEAFVVLDEAGGLGAPDPGEPGGIGEIDEPSDEVAVAEGEQVFRRIYGAGADRVRRKLRDGHPLLERFVLRHAYGRVLARPGLAADRRELCAIACLAALGQDRQLASHVRGGLHCGATPEELHGALDAVRDLIDETDLRHAERVIERFAQ